MKILLGMSGGLDSTYAAYLLKNQGHDVHGAVLQMHAYTELCDAAQSAQAVGIPLHTVDCQALFAEKVQAPFMQEYLAGRTPNPCVLCNRDVKFQGLLDYADLHGFDAIATGHYSRIACLDGRYAVCQADDRKKDQSYVLWRLSQTQLSRLITPLCNYTKEEIRAHALSLGFSAAQKKDSQEICFIPDRDYAAYIEARHGKMPSGDFIDWNGNAVGRHRGILHYTVGQRKGLGIALGEPVYVKHIDPHTNTVHLARAGGEFQTSMEVHSLVFQAMAPTDHAEFDAQVKIRYSAPPATVHVTVDGDRARVTFPSPLRAVTPGQSAVFYRDSAILFGGFIG